MKIIRWSRLFYSKGIIFTETTVNNSVVVIAYNTRYLRQLWSAPSTVSRVLMSFVFRAKLIQTYIKFPQFNSISSKFIMNYVYSTAKNVALKQRQKFRTFDGDLVVSVCRLVHTIILKNSVRFGRNLLHLDVFFKHGLSLKIDLIVPILFVPYS